MIHSRYASILSISYAHSILWIFWSNLYCRRYKNLPSGVRTKKLLFQNMNVMKIWYTDEIWPDLRIVLTRYISGVKNQLPSLFMSVTLSRAILNVSKISQNYPWTPFVNIDIPMATFVANTTKLLENCNVCGSHHQQIYWRKFSSFQALAILWCSMKLTFHTQATFNIFRLDDIPLIIEKRMEILLLARANARISRWDKRNIKQKTNKAILIILII